MFKNIVVLDTETLNLIKSEKVLPHNNLPYHIGWSVVRPTTGEVMTEHSFIIKEFFFDEAERMRSAYYADKIPQYLMGIASGEHKVVSFFDAMLTLSAECRKYNVIAICAHNARFDVDALNTAVHYLTGEYIHALPDDLEVWDSMKMAKSIYGSRPSYRKFCETHGLMTAHKTPRVRMTAEALFQFLTSDPSFSEAHTALEDVRIEREIIFACYRAHKKMDRVLYHKRES